MSAYGFQQLNYDIMFTVRNSLKHDLDIIRIKRSFVVLNLQKIQLMEYFPNY